MAALFNTFRPTDEAIFIFEGYATAPLASVTQGHLTYAYGAGSDLQAALASIPRQVTTVMYNPEHGPHTPASEQKNLVSTVAAVSAEVRATGRSFDLVPDALFTQAQAAQLAPYADVYVIQAQRYQGNHAQFDRFVGGMTKAIKKANPACQVWIQIQVDTQTGTTPTFSPQGAFAALQSLPSLPDGVAVWTFRNQVSEPQQFLALLRPNG